MKRRPRILGRVLITEGQARDLTDGGTFNVAAEQVRQYCRGPGRIGDLIWVQEPYRFYQAKSMFARSGILVGPVGRARNSLDKRINQERCRVIRESGKYLPRASSGVTLEIMGPVADAGGLSCKVHMRNVDAFVEARET